MSRRARLWQSAREAKYVPQDLSDVPDDDESPEWRDDDPRCYVCGARQSSTDSGCCGVDGEQYECPRW